MSDLLPLLREYANYNLWANQRFVERLQQEPEALLDEAVVSSFPSVRKTVLHVRDAENAWMCRLNNAPVPWPAEDTHDLGGLLRVSTRLRDLVMSYDATAVQSERAYKTLKGDAQRSPVWRMLHHCFNHSTQHRGQLITLMRTLGLEAIPANDLVLFHRTLTT